LEEKFIAEGENEEDEDPNEVARQATATARRVAVHVYNGLRKPKDRQNMRYIMDILADKDVPFYEFNEEDTDERLGFWDESKDTGLF